MCDDSTASRILNAAGPIFAEKGYQSATIREICEAAGVNVAAVNYYFRDKQNLYLETAKLARETRAERVPMPVWTVDTPTEEKLRGFIKTLTHRMLGLQQAPWQVRLMIREIMNPTEACSELVRDYFRPLFELLLGILDEVLPANTPLDVRQKIGFSIIGQCVHYRFAGHVVALMVGDDELRTNYAIDQLADHVTRFSLAALGLTAAIGQPTSATEATTRATE